MIKEIYDILNFHLGQKNRRGQIQLSDDYDQLKSDLGAYAMHLYRCGIIEGYSKAHMKLQSSIHKTSQDLCNLHRDLVNDRKDRRPESKSGNEKLGYAVRWVHNNRKCCFCEGKITMLDYDAREDLMSVVCLNKKCGKNYLMYKFEIWQ